MDSFSKIALSAQAAEAIVAEHFGPAVRLAHFEELKEGFFNAAALLQLSDGRKLVLKAAPPAEVSVLRYERDILRAEVESLRRVRAETDVPAPEVYVYDPSCRLLPSPFFLMEFIPGDSFFHLKPGLDAAAIDRIDAAVGASIRALSQVRGPAFGYWSQPADPSATWRECFLGMIQGVLQDGLDLQVDLGLPYAEIQRRIAALAPALDEVREPRLVHWDLWDGNIFIDPASAEITGIIDFERVLWGDPLIEEVFADNDPNSSAMRGYGENLLALPGAPARRLLYNVYLHLIMVVECYYRRYPTPDQENWIRPILAAELEELLRVQY